MRRNNNLIFCDIDSVLSDFSSSFAEHCKKKVGVKIDRRKHRLWQLNSLFSTPKQFKFVWDTYIKERGFFKQSMVLRALWGVEQLYKMGYEIVYITMRPLTKEVSADTRQWLEKKGFLKFGKHIIETLHKDYSVKKYRPKFFIEDNLETVLPFADKKITFPILYARIYNRTNKVKRCKNWKEIVEFIKNYKR